MKRVTGLGGFFFKTKDPKTTKEWYGKHLGLPVDDYGCTFWWIDKDGNDCSTQWSPFKKSSWRNRRIRIWKIRMDRGPRR